MLIRTLLLLVILLLIGSFFAFDLGRYLTLELLQSQRQELQDLYSNDPLTIVAAYVAIYILVAGLSLPGAVIMTLAGGATFGLGVGTIAVSLGSTVGATVAFLASRFLLRDTIQQRFQDKLATFNQGIEREGGFYLFTLRLIPLFPFFMINLVMGITALRTWKFFFISQLGMLPGTLVYVNAGVQLSSLDSLSGILSLPLLLSFALLGVFPLIAKKGVEGFKARQILKGYQRPQQFDYNLTVVGGGSAGLVSSYIAAAVKAKVALIERHKMGGDCLNTGCVPSKALIRSAKMVAYANRAQEFGFRSTTVEYEFAEVMERVQRVITKVEPHDSIERYSNLGVECLTGEATIRSPWEVEINGKTISSRAIIVATGARPMVPLIPGLDQIDYLTSDTVWNLRQRPERMVVLGGGPIGCELAQSFQRLGVKVSLIQRGPQVMPREDVEVSQLVRQRFEQEGMSVLTGHTAQRFEIQDEEKFVVCEFEGEEVRVGFDQVLIALGRKANISGFGLEELGVTLNDNGTVAADPFLTTNYPNIYVCGDVTGPYQFTHTAAHQAWYAAVNALFAPLKRFKADYSVIPWATYTDPEVARVGLNELEAKEQGIAYEVTHYGIDDLDRAIADEEDHGLVKVLTVPGKDKILGVTIAGSHAGDLIAEFVTAMKYGLGLNKILGTIHIYPTLAEANKYVAGNWKRAHKPDGLLRWVERFHRWRRS
ncbi:MAG: FAD-dependent oxidoreductase [Gammaproteobacteria bacterium]|nr:FAD-dependent oxidoreductase [Gammaproteobacteria bacterium]